MEDQHFLDNDNLKVENERPTFLTVLCIITFVISGLFFLSGVYGAMTYQKEAQIEANEIALEQMIEIAATDETGAVDGVINSMEVFNTENIENASTIMTINIIASLLSLLGAFFMYSLKKIGFHTYIVSKLVSAIPLLLYTLSMPVVLGYGVFLLFTLAFIIMYSRNLKHMK